MLTPTNCELCGRRLRRRWWHRLTMPLPLCPRSERARCDRDRIFSRWDAA